MLRLDSVFKLKKPAHFKKPAFGNKYSLAYVIGNYLFYFELRKILKLASSR